MIRLDQLADKSYLVDCPECGGLGILQPEIWERSWPTCNLCHGKKKVTKLKAESYKKENNA